MMYQSEFELLVSGYSIMFSIFLLQLDVAMPAYVHMCIFIYIYTCFMISAGQRQEDKAQPLWAIRTEHPLRGVLATMCNENASQIQIPTHLFHVPNSQVYEEVVSFFFFKSSWSVILFAWQGTPPSTKRNIYIYINHLKWRNWFIADTSSIAFLIAIHSAPRHWSWPWDGDDRTIHRGGRPS